MTESESKSEKQKKEIKTTSDFSDSLSSSEDKNKSAEQGKGSKNLSKDGEGNGATPKNDDGDSNLGSADDSFEKDKNRIHKFKQFQFFQRDAFGKQASEVGYFVTTNDFAKVRSNLRFLKLDGLLATKSSDQQSKLSPANEADAQEQALRELIESANLKSFMKRINPPLQLAMQQKAPLDSERFDRRTSIADGLPGEAR